MSLIKPRDMNFVPKSWGWELWICNSEKYCGKKLFIKQGHNLSFHHHNEKDEVLFVESGEIIFVTEEPVRFEDGEGSFMKRPTGRSLRAGYAHHVLPGQKHQMYAVQDTILFEFSTEHRDEDSIRTTRDLVVDLSTQEEDGAYPGIMWSHELPPADNPPVWGTQGEWAYFQQPEVAPQQPNSKSTEPDFPEWRRIDIPDQGMFDEQLPS